MKRIIAALAFSTLAVPALADNRPFEQTELDRALPNVQERDVAERAGQDQRAVSGFEQYNSI